MPGGVASSFSYSGPSCESSSILVGIDCGVVLEDSEVEMEVAESPLLGVLGLAVLGLSEDTDGTENFASMSMHSLSVLRVGGSGLWT